MSQVNFFMLSSDTSVFLDMLFSRDDTIVHAGRFFASQSPMALGQPVAAYPDGHLVLLHAVLGKDVQPSLIESGPFEGSYRFDTYKAPVIEFALSELQDGTLINGRIFAKIGWLATPEQNRCFRAWYSSIERWLKKHCNRVHGEWWIAPSATDWSKNGGRLALGHMKAKKISLADLEI